MHVRADEIFGALAAISFFLTLWQFVAALRFPLHRRLENKYQPPATFLKPLYGCDAQTRACLESWFQLNYNGAIQILFGVAKETDPVCAVVRELLARHPGIDAELCICPESFGANAKVSTLIQLQRRAKYDFIVVSDADVFVPPDFLSNAISPFSNLDPNTGLVNCFYVLANPSTVAMRLEAVAINADFWSQVLQSRNLAPIDFALGAVMITRNQWLQKIGAFQSLSGYLADDYQLGNQISRAGGKIVISPIVVECRPPPMGWKDVWKHQLRWARTIRACKPVSYFFSILANATLWPWLWLCFHPTKMVFMCVCGLWGVRMGTALFLQARLTRSKKHIYYDWLVLLKDLFHAAIWAFAFAGSTVTWGGENYRIIRDGKLIKTSL